MRETDLYPPVRDFLLAQGFTVRAEVRGCDIVATRGDDLVIVELKLGFGTDLLFQATERQRMTDSVYVALPRPGEGFGRKQWRKMTRLLRRLELGLLLVSVDSEVPLVEIAFHPLPSERRKRSRMSRALLQEMGGRLEDFNEGGSARRKLVTAYRENAIQIACFLERFGPLSPARLRRLGTGPKTLSILSSNFYGWFQRVERGIYTLTRQGKEELDLYPELAGHYREVAGLQDKG